MTRDVPSGISHTSSFTSASIAKTPVALVPVRRFAKRLPVCCALICYGMSVISTINIGRVSVTSQHVPVYLLSFQRPSNLNLLEREGDCLPYPGSEQGQGVHESKLLY